MCPLELNARLSESSSLRLPNLTSGENADSSWKCSPEAEINENRRNLRKAAVRSELIINYEKAITFNVVTQKGQPGILDFGKFSSKVTREFMTLTQRGI